MSPLFCICHVHSRARDQPPRDGSMPRDGAECLTGVHASHWGTACAHAGARLSDASSTRHNGKSFRLHTGVYISLRQRAFQRSLECVIQTISQVTLHMYISDACVVCAECVRECRQLCSETEPKLFRRSMPPVILSVPPLRMVRPVWIVNRCTARTRLSRGRSLRGKERWSDQT